MGVDGTVMRVEKRVAEERITEEKLDQGALMRGRRSRRENAGEIWCRFEAWQRCGMFKAGCKLIPQSWQCLSKAISSPSE